MKLSLFQVSLTRHSKQEPFLSKVIPANWLPVISHATAQPAVRVLQAGSFDILNTTQFLAQAAAPNQHFPQSSGVW